MKPKKQTPSGAEDFFRSRLDNIINLRHELVILAGKIDWDHLDEQVAPYFSHDGRPALPTRFMVGLLLLKHTFNLSDEGVCERWVCDPYFQYFTGEEFFQHAFPHERSNMTHWRQRVGPDFLEKLVQESLRIAHGEGALRTKDLKKVTVDTTVQPKNITFPTDAKLTYRAMVKLAALARKHDVKLRQSYIRVGKQALIMSQRYAHAKQFKRHKRKLKFLRTRLGRVIRDIDRKIDGNEERQEIFRDALNLAVKIRHQKTRQDTPKVYSLHAPEVECIGKGKAHKPYEFGCKVSVATTNALAPGGQFVLHVKALHGNPYDGHTLGPVIKELEQWTGIEPERIFVDKGYAGHNYPNKFRVYKSGQKRGLTPAIKKELRRRAAVEPLIGHMKQDSRMGRNYLLGKDGDKVNALLAAAGLNFRLLLRWFRKFLRLFLFALFNLQKSKQSQIKINFLLQPAF